MKDGKTPPSKELEYLGQCSPSTGSFRDGCGDKYLGLLDAETCKRSHMGVVVDPFVFGVVGHLFRV